MKPGTMSVDECIAFVQAKQVSKRNANYPAGTRPDCYYDEPDTIEPTLDAAAAAMPEGWRIEMEQTNAGTFVVRGRTLTDATRYRTQWGYTELLARWRLVVACMMAEKESPNE